MTKTDKNKKKIIAIISGIILIAIITIEPNTAIRYHFNSSLLKNAFI